jgi:hypothetical protein
MIFGSTVTSPDNLNYMAFDTSTDTVSAPVKINNTTTNTLSDTARYSITKGRNGTLYATTSGANGPLVQCSTACTSGGNWTEITNYPFKTATATHHDLKLLSLKSDKLLALQWDITAHQIYYSLYTPSLGTWTAKTSLATAVDSTTYLGAWGATVNKNTGDAYLCFNNNVNNTSGSIQTAKFNDSGLIAGPLATGLTGQNIQCDLAYNEHSGAIVLSRNQVLGSNLSRITVSQSIDNMVNWSNFKTINLTHRNYTQAGLNFSSDRKIYAWYLDDTNHDIYGNTILNIDPSRDRLFTNQGVGDWLHFF